MVPCFHSPNASIDNECRHVRVRIIFNVAHGWANNCHVLEQCHYTMKSIAGLFTFIKLSVAVVYMIFGCFKIRLVLLWDLTIGSTGCCKNTTPLVGLVKLIIVQFSPRHSFTRDQLTGYQVAEIRQLNYGTRQSLLLHGYTRSSMTTINWSRKEYIIFYKSL